MSAPNSPLADRISSLPHFFDGDSDSDLSDVPTNIELPVSNSRMDDADVGLRSVRKAKRRQPSRNGSDLWPTTKKRRVAATETDSDGETDHDEDELDVSGFEELEIDTREGSRFESLPIEKISIDLATDQDLVSLIATCRRLATALNPPNSKTWKVRFLAAYDYPEISASVEYCWVYKERTFVLRNFLSCHRVDLRTFIQLQVLKEMVLETYHVHGSCAPAATSLNLQADSHPRKAEWLRMFLSSPLFNTSFHRYGEPHMLFDAIQITFSYLLLSPASSMAETVSIDRDNYDIENVYNWNQDFTILCGLHEDQRYIGARRSTYPWRIGLEKFPLEWPILKLDMHSLLHIRNFWHRHLLDDGHELQANTGLDERTYSTMANELAALGYIPGPWRARLRQWNIRADGARGGKWIGHYSCLHPWPKTRKDLVDRESCAEDWDKVEPLTLDYDAAESNIDTWPMIFGDIPAIKRTIPRFNMAMLYLRGVAPFLDISTLLDHEKTLLLPSLGTGKDGPTIPRSVKYHPYKALRLRGFMHLLASPESDDQRVGHIVDPEIPIPGFGRVFFVLYKPTSRYLVQVLEHNMGDYGSPWTVHVGQQLQNQQVTVDVPTNAANADGLTDAGLDLEATGDSVGTASVPIQAVVDGNALAHDPVQAEKILRSYLDDLLDGEHDVDVWKNGKRVLEKNEDGIWDFATKKVKNFPLEKMTRENINNMEEAYSDTKFLNWEDIEYAYAYEGVVTPGGKVMMGRWWRIGLNGVGINDGYEIDCEGLGVRVVNGESFVPNPDVEWDGESDWVTVEGMRKKSKGLERGPFVFWTSDSLA